MSVPSQRFAFEGAVSPGGDFPPIGGVPLDEPSGGDIVAAITTAWTRKTKRLSTVKTLDTTFANDPDLKFAVGAGQKYAFRGTVFINAGTTPDFKWRLFGPGAPTRITMWWADYLISGFVNASGYDTAFSTTHIITQSATADIHYEFTGILENPPTGTVAIQWAQNTSNAAATTVLFGSFLEYIRL